MAFSVGDRLGPYELTGAIGAGGMGEVYRARDQRLGRQVALKILPAAFSTDPDRVRRFEQEGRAAAAINHPNVVTIYDAGFDGGVFYVATELLEGETLRARLNGSPLPVRKAVEYAVQIARGLAAAQAKGIIHRDLKPENLFVTKDGLVKILDFGLAKQLVTKQAGAPSELSTEKILTNPGVVLGTAGYMSLEQVRGLLPDVRSDLFSLGAVLYEIVSGKRPFSGESGVELMNAILKQDPPDLDATVPPALERMIRRCLEKKPEERFQSALDLAYALESITGTSSLSAERNLEAQTLRRPYVRAIAAAAALCFVLAAGVAARGWFLRPASPSYQRITYRRGYVENARFATGGRTVVYSASWDGNPLKLYSTQAANPESRDLGLTDAHLGGVSKSDEMAVTLGGFSDTTSTLARVPISGGAPRKLADSILSADWAADGERLAVVRAKGGHQQLEFPIGNVLYQTTGGIAAPRISPRGDLIAFAEQPLGSIFSQNGWVSTVDLKGNKKAVTEFWPGVLAGIAWSPSGDEILFTGASFGITSSLYAVTRSGRQRLIAHLPGSFEIEDVAPDGRALMASYLFSNALFFLPTLDAKEKEKDLYWHDLSLLGDISRDGKDLLFSESGDATRSGEDFATYLRSTSGSGAARLGRGVPLEISPDGKWALVLGSTRAPSQLVLLPTGTGEARQLTHDGIHRQGAAWTPDGKRVVFVGNEPGHRIRYYVQNLDGAPPRAITPENVSFNFIYDPVVVSPDGKFVATAGLDGKILLYPLDGGAPREIPKLADGSEPLRWCPDASLLVYHAGTTPLNIMRTDIETGKQTLWRELEPSDRTGLIDIFAARVSADCKSLAYPATYGLSELWIADGLL